MVLIAGANPVVENKFGATANALAIGHGHRAVIDELGLKDDAITIRMTGCPNGCARPYIAEIAFVGRSPGKYNIYLGGGCIGDRLNKLYKVSAKQEEIVVILRPILERYANERNDGERFGDFVIRTGYVAETREGREFHTDFKE